MRKVIAFLIALLLCFSQLTACEPDEKQESTGETFETEPKNETISDQPPGTTDSNIYENTQNKATEPTEPKQTEPAEETGYNNADDTGIF